MPYYYTTGAKTSSAPNHSPTRVQVFEFYRFRFWFEAVDAVRFPPGPSANVLRGALGTHLLEEASPSAYRSLFQPGHGGKGGPSGLADWPRPFVLRGAHLDGATFPPGTPFFFDAHVFDMRRPLLASFSAAFHRAAEAGLGLGRGRARLTSVAQLDLAGTPQPLEGAAPCLVSLDGPVTPVHRVTLWFASPTELKGGGRLTDRQLGSDLWPPPPGRGLPGPGGTRGPGTAGAMRSGLGVCRAKIHPDRSYPSARRLYRRSGVSRGIGRIPALAAGCPVGRGWPANRLGQG
jgi:hypothetical protein